MLVSPADLARLKGVTLPAISQRMRGRLAGAVVVQGDQKLIDLDRALELWDGGKRGRPRLGSKPVPKEPQEAAIDLVDALPSGQVPPLMESKARREHYLAELARLQFEQQSGDLLAADDVKKSAFAMARAIREAFMNMGDRLSFEFAGETDETVINQTLTEELRKVLEELCKEVSE